MFYENQLRLIDCQSNINDITIPKYTVFIIKKCILYKDTILKLKGIKKKKF